MLRISKVHKVLHTLYTIRWERLWRLFKCWQNYLD
jgi:hypothetical protein